MIEVEFRHRIGEYVRYTKAVLWLMMADPDVLHILDTGVLLK